MYHKIELKDSQNKTVIIYFNKVNIHIQDSYQVQSSKDMKALLKLVTYAASNYDISYKRSMCSWLREWKSHNILYKLNIQRQSSKDTDLSEKESFKRLLAYHILSLFYWK